MKNLFLITLISLVFASGAVAQESETGIVRLGLSAGLYSTKDIHTSIHYSDADVWGRYSSANYFLDFSFYRHKKVEVGLGLGYQSPQPKQKDYVGLQSETALLDDNSLDVQYFTVLPQIRFNWITSEDNFLELYSSLALGLTIVDVKYSNRPQPDETYPLPALHVNWLGMRFGDKFGGFIEFGLGTKGLIAGGLSYRM